MEEEGVAAMERLVSQASDEIEAGHTVGVCHRASPEATSPAKGNFTGLFINMLCAIGVRGCLLNGQASRGLLVVLNSLPLRRAAALEPFSNIMELKSRLLSTPPGILALISKSRDASDQSPDVSNQTPELTIPTLHWQMLNTLSASVPDSDPN
ncbi:unnamed protein product [Leuciscus chuanchicus]